MTAFNADDDRAPVGRAAGNKLAVGYLVGSLSTVSINRKLALALVRLAPSGMAMTEITFRELPFYSADLEADSPPAVRAFKAAIAAVDATLFVTPEYNRSIPGGLKNAIDWASRPFRQNSFNNKPSGIVGASPGKIGTAIAQQSLRNVLSFCNSPLMNTPEAYIQFTPGMIADDGTITLPATADFLRTYMAEFYAFVMRCCTALPNNIADPKRGEPRP